jgi:SAM-dependent methyltransferase
VNDGALSDVAAYYGRKLAAHGPAPAGVDWNSAASQVLRFTQLLRLLDGEADVSINDYGCGYGALSDYLHDVAPAATCTGYDIAETMVQSAASRHAGCGRCRFTTDRAALEIADYTVASGIFNVKLSADPDAWREHLLATLDDMRSVSRRGFAFNVLTSYSDADRQRPDLYYADPLALFDICKRRYSKQVALLHDYPLYEFTMIVRLTDG